MQNLNRLSLYAFFGHILSSNTVINIVVNNLPLRIQSDLKLLSFNAAVNFCRPIFIVVVVPAPPLSTIELINYIFSAALSIPKVPGQYNKLFEQVSTKK